MAPFTVNLIEWIGSVPEWLMGADCKSAGYAYVGSNPTRPIISTSPCSSAVEHSLGKGEVSGSSPDEGIVGGTSKRFNRNQETSKGLFFNANALLLQENWKDWGKRCFRTKLSLKLREQTFARKTLKLLSFW